MFDDADRCPCGSGKTVLDCVCKSRKFVPPPVKTIAPGLVTGLSVGNCYAASTKNCSGRLTREHSISASVLRFLTAGDKMVGISNHPWQTPETINPIAIAGLASHVLCERHNAALSTLDAFAIRFIEARSECIVRVSGGTTPAYHRLFNGFDLERWLLKVLCGVASSGFASKHKIRRGWSPPNEWLRILFGEIPFPRGCGLFLVRRTKPLSSRSVYVKPLRVRAYPTEQSGIPLLSYLAVEVLVGVEFSLLDLCFQLYLATPRRLAGFEKQRRVYRPRMISVRAVPPLEAVATLHLGWDEAPPTFAGRRVETTHRFVRTDEVRRAEERLRRRTAG
jgi:hypothetical protein